MIKVNQNPKKAVVIVIGTCCVPWAYCRRFNPGPGLSWIPSISQSFKTQDNTVDGSSEDHLWWIWSLKRKKYMWIPWGLTHILQRCCCLCYQRKWILNKKMESQEKELKKMIKEMYYITGNARNLSKRGGKPCSGHIFKVDQNPFEWWWWLSLDWYCVLYLECPVRGSIPCPGLSRLLFK